MHYYTIWCLQIFNFSILFAGSHSRSFGQMDTNRRRDLGQSHSAREKPPGGQSVRPSADTHGERVRRGIRWIQVNSVDLYMGMLFQNVNTSSTRTQSWVKSSIKNKDPFEDFISKSSTILKI